VLLAAGMMMLGYGLILLGKQERAEKILSR